MGLSRLPITPKGIRRFSLAAAIVTTVLGCFLTYKAASWERTGTAFAIESVQPLRGHDVTRTTQPHDFRIATNLVWALGLFSLMIAASGFLCYQKLGEHVW